ncbi:MAG: MerR family transcriptional regulator [Candidatus Devosia symbiotica]|nr:MerR family transcriptional regulator [Candidatus Devosia symbiotica]
MTFSNRNLKHADAARLLGVSGKALRLYENRGLVVPDRTAAGWWVYGPAVLARAAKIVALRGLRLSLAEIEWVLAGDGRGLQFAIETNQCVLEARLQALIAAKIRDLPGTLAQGAEPELQVLQQLVGQASEPAVDFNLLCPWGDDRFTLRDLAARTFIIGPLGSGKTRLAMRLAETLDDTAFLDLARLENDSAAAQARIMSESTLRARVDKALGWMVEDGLDHAS